MPLQQGTLTNTALVLSMYNIFGGSITAGIYETFKTIIMTVVSVNGVIELAAAIILVPLIYGRIAAADKHMKNRIKLIFTGRKALPFVFFCSKNEIGQIVFSKGQLVRSVKYYDRRTQVAK